ncbi:MAG: integrase core domain-containing protein [Gammaproteobacteria bacterium]|nr:integrase core domain-containing protein [Gammaproteobacteria bacterium]
MARRRYTPKLQAQLVLEVLTGDRKRGQIAKAYGVHPNSVELCNRRFVERGPEIFAEEKTVKECDRSTLAYVREPAYNGVAERFIQTLKEECIHLRDFETLEEDGAVIGAFIERYNNGWVHQRPGYMTPAPAREQLSRKAV